MAKKPVRFVTHTTTFFLINLNTASSFAKITTFFIEDYRVVILPLMYLKLNLSQRKILPKTSTCTLLFHVSRASFLAKTSQENMASCAAVTSKITRVMIISEL